jgi:alkylation response protein AidB-like acyl-CoA dehydrogenase
MERTLYDSDHDLFAKTVDAFVDAEMKPYWLQWEEDGIVPKEVFKKAGEMGLLGMAVPEEYGGPGMPDFRWNATVAERMMYAGIGAAGAGIVLHNDVCLPYFLDIANEEQKQRWLPGMVNGDHMTAIAMTEPGTGSDLAGVKTTAIKDGDSYILNGSKTFITNGINADVVIVVAKTDPTQSHAGMSLLVVEEGMEGFERGRNLDKLGMHSQDTAELFFNDVRVPAENLLGAEGAGFFALVHNLPQERLSISVSAIASCEAALDMTIDYVKERNAFGRSIASFQNTRFEIAEMKTEIEIGRAYVDRQIEALTNGTLSVEDAAMGKWWTTDLQGKVMDRCLQLHGGYGYMMEYPIARAFADARVQRIYGGTNEIMKEIVGRSVLA